jgi:hypothetical protein
MKALLLNPSKVPRTKHMSISPAPQHILSAVCTFLFLLSVDHAANAQQAYYGDSDSFRGIEEQAKRRAKAEADAAATSRIYTKHVTEVNRINAESRDKWDTLHADFRKLYLMHKNGLDENSNLPAYLQRQYFDIVRLDIQRYDAAVQWLKDSNRAQIEFALIKNQQQNFQLLQDSQNHEAAARQKKMIEDSKKTYQSTLESLRTSQANASRLNEKRETDVRSYNNSFDAWKDIQNTTYRNLPTPGASGGAERDDYDLAGALRDKLQSMNNGHHH